MQCVKTQHLKARFWNWCLKTIWHYVMSVYFELQKSLHPTGEVSIASVRTEQTG